jgi:DNA-directed RNA polymerase subunit RPC12/RpoP
MAIKVKSTPESTWPKEVKCSHCTSELEIEILGDISGERGSQYNESYTNLYISCPVCSNRVVLNEDDFTPYEISRICQSTRSKLAEYYYNK